MSLEVFSQGVKTDHWHEMDYSNIYIFTIDFLHIRSQQNVLSYAVSEYSSYKKIYKNIQRNHGILPLCTELR